MKKLSYLLGLTLISGLIFTSCGGDDEKELLPPSLSFLGGQYEPGHDRVDGDVTLTVGTPFVFGIAGSTNSDKDLKRLRIERKYENVSTLEVLDSTFSVSAISFDIQVVSYPNVGSEDFECTLWDKNDKSTTISFTVTTEAAAPDITVYTDVILGSQTNNQDGSFFASLDGTVYNQAEAKINYDKVDFLYYYGASNLATIASPDDADAATIYNNAVNGLQTWTDLNSTKFKVTSLSTTDFNAITTSNQIITSATLPSEPNSSDATDLSVGDVLAYKTMDAQYGLIHIDAIVTTGTFQSIEITVKKP
jgi:hypothetical protein